MADNYLITGYWGEPHVTAENDRGIHAAIFGAGRYVLPVGNKFRAEYIGNNTVRIYDGKLMDNGAAAGITAGEYVDLTIANASQGMNRNDIIAFQYSKDSSTLVETGTFVVIQGEEVSGTASDPALTQADLLTNTATFDQMALWRVPVASTAISAPVQVFELRSNIYAAINGKAPKSHASADTTYGVAKQSVYGHVKLSSNTDDTYGVNDGVAAAPFGVNKAYNKAVDAQEKADLAYSTANGAAAVANAALSRIGGTITGDLTVNGELNGMKQKAGWKVVATTTDSNRALLFSSSALNTLFGTTGVTYTNANMVIVASNGDWSAYQNGIVAACYSDAGNWYVTTANGQNFDVTQIRVNYIAVAF